MKLIVLSLTFLCLSASYSQMQNTPTPVVQHFAQCMFSITDQTQLDVLTVEFYNSHPEVERVRFDMNTQRALVITIGLTSFTEADFTSWFGQYSSTVTCVQVGVYGVDAMNSYPFTNCQ